MLFLVLPTLAGQGKDPLGSYRKETLEVYLDRADREASSDNWFGFADMGREAALAQWEEGALLAMQESDIDAARASVEDAIGTETRGRYCEWLVARFTERLAGGVVPSGLGDLRDAIARQNGSLLFERDADGNILRDSVGDPVLKTFVGFKEDSAAWEASVGKSIDDSLASWESSFEAAFPELLSQVPESDRRELEAFGASYAELGASAYRRELAALSLQEEQRFVALRSYDQYSLRRKSEEETASAITDRLIAETQGATEEGIRNLRESLAADSGVGPGEGQIDAARWQESFQRIFEAGLATWDKAGARLLAERVEWENKAGKDYNDGEKAWADAYERLCGERDRWQADLRALLAAGGEAWADKDSELENSIAEASAELEKEIRDRKAAKSEDVASLVDIFAQSASMVATAKDSAAYWLKKIGVVVADGSSEREALERYAKGKAGAEEDENYRQAAYWVGIIAVYTKYNGDAREELKDSYSRVISDDGAAKSLLGITDASVDIGSLCLDEYQVELLKAEALASYWDRQVDIADKVYAYAITISSERPTAAQTEAACRNALAEYAAARDSYTSALKELERKGLELGSAKDALAAKRASLVEAKTKLEEAQKDYETLQAIFAAKDNKDYFMKELTSYYQSFLDGLDPAKEGSIAASMASYLTAARSYGFEAAIQLNNRRLEQLVSGDKSLRMDSLESLREKVSSLVVPKNESELAFVSIDATDSLYEAYAQAKGKYDQASSANKAAEAELYLQVCRSIALQYRASLQTRLDEREDALRLLSASSAAQWCEAETGKRPAGDSVAAAAAAVAKDAREAAGNYLAARADLEAKAYGAIEAAKATGFSWTRWSYDESKPEELLACAVSGFVSGGAAKQAALRALSVFLGSGHLDLQASRDALYAFIADYAGDADSKEFLRGFVGGKTDFYSILSPDGRVAVDLAGGLLLEAARERDRSLRLPGIIERYAAQSLAFAEAIEADGGVELKSAMSSFGLLASGPGFSFVGPSVVWDSVSAMSPTARETWLVSVLAATRRAEAKLPGYQAERLEAYLSDLEGYFAAREELTGSGKAASGSAADLKAELTDLKAELDSLSGLKQGCSSLDKRLLNLAGLYAWARGDPSASLDELAAAKSCLIEAGAVETVKSAIAESADPAVSLEAAVTWDDAFATVFDEAAASLADIRASVIARARELFAIDMSLQGSAAASGAESKKAAAYALWKEKSLAVDASRVTISEQGGLIVDLWKLLGGSYSGKAEELDKVDAFLLGLGVEEQDLVANLLEAVRTGPVPMQSVFLDALCPGLAAESVQAQAYDGLGGEVFERAFAIDLASKALGDRGRDCYELLLSLSGIQTHGNIDALWIGSSQKDSLGIALATLSGTAFDEDALIFRLKSKAAIGDAIDLGGLSAAGRAEVQAFASRLDASRLFIRGVGQNALDYALSGSAGSLADKLEIAAAGDGGCSDDLFYTASLGLGNTASGYLSSLERALVGSDRSYDGGLATEALSLLEKRLDDSLAEEGDRYAETLARYGIRCARDACLASSGAAYRASLIAGNFSAPTSGDPLPISTEAIDASLLDAAGDIVHAKGGGLLNLALETAGDLDASGRALALSFESAAALDLSARQKKYEDYCASIAKFLDAAAPVSIWTAATDSYAPIASLNALEKAAADLNEKKARIAGLKSEIGRIGEGLSGYTEDEGARKALLTSQKDQVDAARGSYDRASEDMKIASDSFGLAMTDYNSAYRGSRQSYELMEGARQESEGKEAINDYAQSAYLKLDGTASGSYRSPTDALSYARLKLDKARNLVTALTGLYDETTASREADTPEILAYRDSYRRYIELARLQSQLDRAIAAQQMATDEAKQAFDKAVGEAFAAAPKLKPDYVAEDLSSTADDLSLGECDLLACDPSAGLSLNYDTSSFVISQTSPAQYMGLKAYFEGDEGPAGSSYKDQIASMAQFFAGYTGDAQSLMQQWGLAYEYLKDKLYDANCDVKSGDVAKDILQKTLEGKGIRTDNPAAGLESDNVFNMVATATKADLGDYRGRLDASCAAAYASVMGDATQKRLFEFLVAAKLSGLCAASDFLDKASTLALAADARGMLDSAAASHHDSYWILQGVAAAYFTSAAVAGLCFFTWPLAIALAAEGGIVQLAASLEYDEYDKAAAARDRMDTILNTSGGYSSLFGDGVSALVADENGINSTHGIWVQKKADLAALKGSKPGGAQLSADEALASLTKAIRSLKADPRAALSEDEENYIADTFASGDVKASDASSVLAACVAEAKNSKDRSEAILKAAVVDDKADQAAAQAAYISAMSAYVNGDPVASLDLVKTAAKRAFGSASGDKSAYAEIACENELAAAYADLSSGDPGREKLYENAKAEILSSYAETAIELYAVRLDALKELRAAEWGLRRLDLRDKEAAWSSMINATVAKAAQAWKDGTDKLDRSFREWQKSFAKEYRAKDELWGEGYLAFAQNKQAWVDDLALKAGKAGGDEILAEADMSATLMSRDLSFVAGMSVAAIDPAAMVSGLLGGMNLGDTLATLGKRNGGIASLGFDLQGGMGIDASGSASAMALVASFQASQDEELSKRASLIVADKARDSLDKAKEGYKEIVVQANDGFESNMDDMYLSSAFLKTGGAYVRDAIVDATASGALKEEQRVESYRRFATPDFATQTSLAQSDLDGLSAEAIQALMNKAMKELDDKRQDIFGKDDMSQADKDALKKTLKINGSGGGDPQDLTDYTEATRTWTEWESYTDNYGHIQTRQVERNEKYKVYTQRDETQEKGAGDFGGHIGYAPIFQKNPDAEDLGKPEDMVVAVGEGEAGRLVMYYSYFQVKEGRGVAEYAKPSWDRKIWDDRGSWMKAPTPAQVVDVGVSIAAMAIGGGPWVAMAINLADDAAFGLMDVAGGYKKADEALFDFGKKALTSVASTAIGGAFGGLSSKMTDTGIGGVIGKTMLKGMELFSSGLASGAIAGISYSHSGGWGYNYDAFAENAFGEGALAGYASGMASSFATGVLSSLDLQDANGYALDDTSFDTKRIASFNGIMGSLAGQGLSYAMSGEASFNIANMRDLSGGKLQGALLEMHIGGSDGFSMELGQGGADISATMLGASLNGMIEAGKIGKAKVAALFGSMEGASTLDAANFLGYSGQGELAKRIWSGGLKASYSDKLIVKADGSGDYGSYSSADPATITLSSGLVGLGKEKAALLASVMAHEGDHADGIHVEAGAITDQLRTYATLLEMFHIEGNSDYVKGSFAALMDPGLWMENPEGIDHLTILKNGSWKRDGDNKNINFENGRPSIPVSTPGFQSGIEQFYGIAGGEGYQDLLKGLGYSYDKAAQKWSGPDIVGRADIEKAYKEGKISKGIADKVLGDMDKSNMSPTDNLLAQYAQQAKYTSDMKLSAAQLIWQGLASLFSAKKQEKVEDKANVAFTQKDFERDLGFTQPGLCNATTWAYAYQNRFGGDYAAYLAAMTEAMKDPRIIDSEGYIWKTGLYSKQLAETAGVGEYADYIYDENREKVVFDSVDELLKAGYTEAQLYYLNEKKNSHFTYYNSQLPDVERDPYPWNSNLSAHGYVLTKVRPIQWLPYKAGGK